MVSPFLLPDSDAILFLSISPHFSDTDADLGWQHDKGVSINEIYTKPNNHTVA